MRPAMVKGKILMAPGVRGDRARGVLELEVRSSNRKVD